jgi:hypothetical protein
MLFTKMLGKMLFVKIKKFLRKKERQYCDNEKERKYGFYQDERQRNFYYNYDIS